MRRPPSRQRVVFLPVQAATDSVKVTLRDGREDGSFLPERLIQEGYKLRSFKEEEIDLEDVFMGITKGITN